jgi:hypothetical protein
MCSLFVALNRLCCESGRISQLPAPLADRFRAPMVEREDLLALMKEYTAAILAGLLVHRSAMCCQARDAIPMCAALVLSVILWVFSVQRADSEVELGWPDSSYVVSKIAAYAFMQIIGREEFFAKSPVLVNCVCPG